MGHIEYILRCIKNLKDDSFVKTVMEYRRGYHLISFQTNETYEIDENVYHIVIGNAVDGFFSFFRETLDCLYYADKLGLVSVVEYTNDVKYSEEHLVFGTRNPFEYYFVQPGKYGLGDLCRISRVFLHERPHRNYAEEIGNNTAYNVSEEYISAMAKIARKYIRLRPEVNERMRCDIGAMMFKGKKILGVHYRGTDFKQGYKHHPKIVSVEEYIKIIEELLKQNNYERLFLASDDLEAISCFKKKFKDKICMYEAVRGNSMRSVMFSEMNRAFHHFELGYEVLRDVWTLAQCDGLIAGVSQVSICARIMNRSFDRSYMDEIVIDHGLNNGNRIYRG